ncbi:isopentenyl-diphosphate delta-isomerase [Streptomyces sp. CB02923]|uniref:isopentenyl-diphosphate Delta-isomerase n=1 Tax=Streptomyces sp. CB02923 TaxID=1718985 RepID=UPI00093E0584|nr:isopentenyl-diphosphate Delta-isomerase [Streptomyces sp. CB02923]OKI09455.1 isopentenyl-diphosphate delta-isomerase [Streptomyces sp. CB02923]
MKTFSPGAEETILLELVDPSGTTTGIAEKMSAHEPPGQLHRAFSVFLFDSDGRMLLQRRALSKYHSPGVWSNACCGHPYPDEAPFHAAVRRTGQELGVAPALLAEAGTVTYRHPDALSGLVEHEFNHLFVGLLEARPAPDPAEVADTAFVTAGQLDDRLASAPFSRWFDDVLRAARPTIRRLNPTGGW